MYNKLHLLLWFYALVLLFLAIITVGPTIVKYLTPAEPKQHWDFHAENKKLVEERLRAEEVRKEAEARRKVFWNLEHVRYPKEREEEAATAAVARARRTVGAPMAREGNREEKEGGGEGKTGDGEGMERKLSGLLGALDDKLKAFQVDPVE
ncbi:hypothetical protein HDU98_009495 [Podochytrium sp. JEL0797]|nr:hypothetical protein HDU98_009495 [Podochytrium sp. JEL0797]